jgi:hypothetical protein
MWATFACATAIFLTHFKISIAVLDDMPPEKSHFSTLNVGLTQIGNRTRTTCKAGSVARRSAIHYAFIIPKLSLFAVELLYFCAFYPIKLNLFHHSFFFEDRQTHNVESSILMEVRRLWLHLLTILLLYASYTTLRLFLTPSMTLLDKTCPKNSNGYCFRVIGYTKCRLEQCELLFANF